MADNEYLDLIGAPAQSRQAPQPQSGGKNEYLDLIDSNVIALPRAQAGALKKPEPAGQAVQLGQSMGFPSSVIGADLENYQQIDKGQKAAQAIERNQWISGYVARNPEAAEVSNDDYDKLETLSKKVQPFTIAGRSGGLLQAAPEFVLNTLPQLGSMLSTSEGRSKLLGGVTKFGEQFANILGSPGDAEKQGFDIHDPTDLDRAMSLGMLIGLGKQAPKVGLPVAAKFEIGVRSVSTGAELDRFLIDAILTKGQDPKTVLQIEHAKADSAALDSAVAAAGETATKGRAPTLLDDFVKGHETGTLSIPAETIAEVYRAEGKVPAVGDGLFGFVPDLARKLPGAADTGTEIDVPVASYLAHIDPTVHEKVKEAIRFSNDGMTLAEAKEADPKAGVETLKPIPDDFTFNVRPHASNLMENPPRGLEVDLLNAEGKPAYNAVLRPYDEYLPDLKPNPEAGYHVAYIRNTSRGMQGVERQSGLGPAFYVELARIAKEQGRNLYSGVSEETSRFAKAAQEKLIKAGYAKRDAEYPNKVQIISKIIEEQSELGLRPLFTEALSGQTKTDFERYNKKIIAAQQKALDKATEVQTREAAKRQGEEWKANEAALRPEVEAQVRAFPDIAADRFLRDGTLPDGSTMPKVRLDEGYVNALLPKTEIPAMMLAKDGIHSDDIAPLFGFNSGAEMVRSLNDLNAARRSAKESPTQHLNRLIKEELNAQMEAKYGNLSASIAEEARALALDDLHFDILADELRALATEAGGTMPISKDGIKALVQDHFSRLDAKEAANFKKFQKAAGRNGLLAERALLKGDAIEAFNAKQKQAMNFLLAKEAQKFGKLVDRIAKKIDRVTKNDSISSMDDEHFKQLKSLLSDLGFDTRGDVVRPETSLRDFIDDSNGQLAVASWLTDGTILPRDPSKLTAQQMEEFGKSIDSMMHVGREVKTLDSARGKAEIDDVVFEVKKELDRFDLIKQPLKGNKTLRQRSGSLIRKINAAHALPELILDYTDQFNPQGPLAQFLDRPLRAANNKEIELTEAIVKKLRALQKYTDNSITDQIPNTTIIDPQTGEPLDIVRRNLRQLMGYMGSASGIQKVVGGFAPPATKEIIGYNTNGKPRYRQTAMTSAHQAKLVNDLWKMINENATEADWKWVAGMHDIFRDIFAEGKEMYLKDTGVSPDEIRPQTMHSEKFGDFTGGYWPINYDKTRSNIDPHVFAKHGPFGQDYRPAIPPNSWTKSRTQFQDFLDLSGFLLDSEIRAMIHDIAFRPAIRNAAKLIGNKEFMREMTNKWGKEYADLFPKWLEDIAGSHKYDDAYAQGWARASAFLRQNVTSALTWMAPSTIQKHGLSAAGMSVGEVGRGIFPAFVRIATDGMIDAARTIFRTKPEAPSPEMIQAIKDITDPGERGETTRQFIQDSSAAVRSRNMRFADTIKGAYEPSVYSPSSMILWDARQMSMNLGRFPISFVDAMSAYPTWLVAYKKAIMETGGDKAQAVYEADKAMSRAHGSTSILDRSALMRSGELMRWFTSLFGFWNHNTNIRMRMAWDIAGMAKGREEPGATAGQVSNKFFWSILIPLMAEELATPYLDEDRRSWGHRMFLASLRFFGGGYVGLRDITNGFAHGMEPSVGMMSTFLKTLDMAWKGAKGGNKSKNALINELMALSFMTGIGGGPPAKVISYTKDRITGKERAGTFGQTLQGLRTGHSQPRIHK